MKGVRLLAVVAIVVCAVAISSRPAQAGYPSPGRFTWAWYGCFTSSSSGTSNSYVEPICEQLQWEPNGSGGWRSDYMNMSPNCQPGTCADYSRWYIVPPDGVTAFYVECGFNMNVQDNGLGAGQGGGRGDTSGGHLAKTGDANWAGNVVGSSGATGHYTYTHTGADGYFSHPSHEPVSGWFVTGAPLGGYVQAHVATSGNQVTAIQESGCFVTGFSVAGSPGPTPSPTASNTPTSTPTFTPTPTITPSPTGTIVDPTATRTPGPGVWPTPLPWPTIVPWLSTPAPPILTIGDPLPTPNCYRIIPDFHYDLDTGIFGYTQTVGVEPVDLCLDEREIDVVILDWDIGQIFWWGMFMSACGVVLAFFRRG